MQSQTYIQKKNLPFKIITKSQNSLNSSVGKEKK